MKHKDEDMGLIQQHLDNLGEHFDAVQIFCTRHEAGEEDGTVSATLGSGNWFARCGQIREWLIKQDEYSKETARNDN